MEKYSYEQVKEIADFLLGKTTVRPTLGIICGSGLGGLADLLTDAQSIEYEAIPGFPVSTVKGHGGKLVFGKLEGVECVCMKGRFHHYEGYPAWKTAVPVQVMSLLGVKALIVTNAAGGLPDTPANLALGDFMLITDHINLVGMTGESPLRGPNDERFGPRFPPSNTIYSEDLQEIFRKAADDQESLGLVKEGTYCMCAGPSYETCAELRMFKTMGVDAVGMSTVPETIVAGHLGIKVLGISLITNVCIMDVKSKVVPYHGEVLETANLRAELLQNIVKLTVRWGQHIWTEGM